MVRFDESETGEDCPPDGKYLWEIVASEAKRSKKGVPMLSWKLKIVEGECQGAITFDNAMMGGPGAGMGKAKAKAFGIVLEHGKDIDESEFVGRRAWGYAKQEEYRGRVNLKIDANEGEYCGYDAVAPATGRAKFDENDPGLDAVAGPKGDDGDMDIPF